MNLSSGSLGGSRRPQPVPGSGRGPRGPRSPQGGSSGPLRDPAPPGQPKFPRHYLEQGYFDEKGTIRRELVLDHAEEIGRDVLAKDKSLVKKGMGSTALRSFFSHVRRIETHLDAGRSFDGLRPEIWRLRTMAEYQRQRKEPPINESFIEFITKNVPLAQKDEKHFRAFVTHFESVMAFFPRQHN